MIIMNKHCYGSACSVSMQTRVWSPKSDKNKMMQCKSSQQHTTMKVECKRAVTKKEQ